MQLRSAPLLCAGALLAAASTAGAQEPGASLQRFVLAEAPENFEMEAVVFCSSVPERAEPVRSALKPFATEPSSIDGWSNAVSTLVAELLRENSGAVRQLWHLRFMKSGQNVRLDTLEDLYGDRVAGTGFSNAPQTRISVGNPTNRNHKNHYVTPHKEAIRVAVDPRSFQTVVPLSHLVEFPQTIQLMIKLVQTDPGEVIFTNTPLGGSLRSVEMRTKAGPQRTFPMLRAIRDEQSRNWLGLFELGEDGDVTSAALSATALGWPIRSPTLFCDRRGNGRTVVTVVSPSRTAVGAVSDSAFAVNVPDDWTVIDEVRGVATRGVGGEVIGTVEPLSRPREEADATRGIRRLLIVTLPCLTLVLPAVFLAKRLLGRRPAGGGGSDN